MAVYVVVAFDDDTQARTFVEETLLRQKLGDPETGDGLEYTIRGVFKKPTQFCECKGLKRTTGFTRGRNYGWWVCARCLKPTKKWASGDMWFSTLGTNLIPKSALAPEYRPGGWTSPKEWTFLGDLLNSGSPVLTDQETTGANSGDVPKEG